MATKSKEASVKNGAKRVFSRAKNTRALNLIKEAGSNLQQVRIKYKKKSGEVVTRTVRPYEIKGHRTSGKRMLYVSDNKHGANQILSLHTSSILDAKLVGKTFKPVWEVALEPPSSKKKRKVK